MFLTLGACSQKEPVPEVVEEAFFCDLVTENFRYTQKEIDTRAAQFPTNLRREFEINKHRDRECTENTDE